jgi:hypothetical protein
MRAADHPNSSLLTLIMNGSPTIAPLRHIGFAFTILPIAIGPTETERIDHRRDQGSAGACQYVHHFGAQELWLQSRKWLDIARKRGDCNE